MRSRNQMLYDRLYYGFERRLNVAGMNYWNWRKFLGKKFDRSFYEFYRNTVLPYWAPYGVRPKINWYKYYYSLTGVMDPRYIPDDIHMLYIIPHFDREIFIRALTDKNMHSLTFPGVRRPETVYKRIDGCCTNDDFTPISEDEAFSRCLEPVRYIVKPTVDTGKGQDIRFFSGSDAPEEIRSLLSNYSGIDYIVQKVVKQHQSLAQFNASSLNTIRIVTLFLNGKPHILSSILRIGADGSEVDNFSRGGYQCTIRPDGCLEPLAYTRRSGKPEFVEETADGLRFDSLCIPSWDTIRQTALTLSTELPHLKFIGWDFGVDENGEVVLIEFNCELGQNQGTCGPTFGELTDEVLSEVFRERMNKRARKTS